MMLKNKLLSKDAKKGFIQGFFWSIGVTLGFAFVTAIVALLLSRIDTVPVIGNFVADIVRETLRALGSTR